MRKLLLLTVALLALAVPTAALAQVQIRLRMGFPAILPPLVEVQPGVRVVQDFDEEVFFIGGFYWFQRDGNWYRTRDHRGTWSYVQPRGLPPALVHHQPGQYRRWQHDEHRAWPDARQAKGNARHWKAAEYREGPQQDHHEKGNGHDGDRHEQERH